MGDRHSLSDWLQARWGWIVCGATFVIHIGMFALGYTYSLFFVEIQRELNATAVEIGWTGSAIFGVQMFSSPIGSLIESWVGYRVTMILVVLVSTVAIISGSVVHTFPQLFVTVGVIYGLSLGIAWFVMISVLVQYFPAKNSVRAVSLSTMGATFALLILSQPVGICIEALGWRHSLQFVAAFTLIVSLPPAFLVSPPSDGRGSLFTSQKAEYGSQNKEDTNQRGYAAGTQNTRGHEIEYKTREVKTDDLDVNEDSTDHDTMGFMMHDVSQKAAGDLTQDSRDSNTGNYNSITEAGTRMLEGNGEYGNELTSDAPQNSRNRLERWRTAVSASAFFYSVSTVTCAMAWSVFVVNIVSYYHSIGINTYQSASLLMVSSITELLAKLGLATLGERFPYKKTYLLLAKIVLLSCLSVMMTLATSYWYFVSMSIVIGILRACFNVLLYPCSIETFGAGCRDEAIIIVSVSRGIGFMTGTLPAGAIYDAVGSYRFSFLLIGAISAFSAAALWLAMLCSGRSQQRTASPT